MKRIFTSPAISTKRALRSGLFALLCSVFCTAAVLGQHASATQEIGNLAGTTWKSATDLSDAFTSERAKMDVMLAAPGLPQADRALFLSYKRLLDYLEADVQAGNPLEESLVKNFDKVVAGASHDADLKHLPENGLTTLLPGLLEALTGVQAVVPGQ